MKTIKEQRLEMKKVLVESYAKKLDTMPFVEIEDEYEQLDSLINPCLKVYIAGRKLQAQHIEELRLLVAQELIRLQNHKSFKWCDQKIYYKNKVAGVMTNPFEEKQNA
jgi:hypothetical protein